MTAFAAFHIKDSGQYSINTKASGKFAQKTCKHELYTDSDTVKLKEQAILSEDLSVNDFDLQGNGDEAEK